jgi:flagellar motility protein MotE (MotC chaperone)
MKYLSLIILSLFIYPAMAMAEKLYTEEEFQKKLQEEVTSKIEKLGNASIIDFSKQLMEKEEKLRALELELRKREDAISNGQRSLQDGLKALQVKQEKFLSCLDDNERRKKERIQHMVDSIAGMKPQNAADLLSVQEADISIQILGSLDSAKVSKIFNLMDKEISARLQKQFMTMKR